MTPWLTFYGDDFTGSTAVMEILNRAGIPTMLFMAPPDVRILDEYPHLQAIGVAGVARSKSPEWMKAHLPNILHSLAKFNAPILHYKVCSTFDSSPEIGSIGVAAEIGSALFDKDWVPLVVGAPAIRRYQAFGTLFAADGQQVYRIDRHPVMSCHPVTPASEADLGQHLAQQTQLKVKVIDLATMKAGKSDEMIDRHLEGGARIIAIDVLDEETLIEAGRVIWRDGATPKFTVGSQGVEYALVAYWKACGRLAAPSAEATLNSVDCLFAISGSCSPTTASQIAFAESQGFQVVDFNAATAIEQTAVDAEVARLKKSCLGLLSQGQDVIVATARGPDDPAIPRMLNAVEHSDTSAQTTYERLAKSLGKLAEEIRLQTAVPRIAICGGDTSGHALSVLQATALSFVAPIEPGAPLCKLHCRAASGINGLEVTLKGGQMGTQEFFVKAKGGVTL